MPVLKTYLLAIALALMLALISGRVLGHDDAAWIQRGDYRDANGYSCCNKTDCHRLENSAVRLTVAGYLVQWRGKAQLVPFSEVKQSENADFWLCERWDQKIRCFFAPPLGS